MKFKPLAPLGGGLGEASLPPFGNKIRVVSVFYFLFFSSNRRRRWIKIKRKMNIKRK
jgi:hypothetical protein